MVKVPTEIIVDLEKIQKRFIWATKSKIKTETMSSNFKDRNLKNIDVTKKITSIQCSWIKRLHDGSFHIWKLIPLKLIKKTFGDELRFNSNLSFNNSYVRHFPCFYKDIFLNWKYFAQKYHETKKSMVQQAYNYR